MEAESVAYIVASSSGMDTSAYSFPYIEHWAPAGKEAEIMADTAERVIATARSILTGPDTLERQAPAKTSDPTARFDT